MGGCTKLVVRRTRTGRDAATGLPTYQFEVVDSFNILGSTSTNCAGGELPFKKWITCEEVVRGPSGGSDGMTAPKKHSYTYEIDAMSDGPVIATSRRSLAPFSGSQGAGSRPHAPLPHYHTEGEIPPIEVYDELTAQ